MAKLAEGHRRIPRADWLNVPALTDAVQVVDLVVTKEDEQAARAYNTERAEAIRLRQQLEHLVDSPPPIGTPRCWCNQDTVDVSSFNQYLAARLKRVKLIRRWRGHRCRQHIKALRTITFVPAVTENPTHAFLNGDAETSNEHVVHIGFTWTPVFAHHNFPQNVGHIIVRIAPSSDNPRLPPIYVDGDDPMRLSPHDINMEPYSSLHYILTRQVANGVALTLVGFERWALSPYDVTYFPTLAKQWFRTRLRVIEHVPEKDIPGIVDRQVKFLTEGHYRRTMGRWYELEEYCAQIEV
jgi:hypothetical protein